MRRTLGVLAALVLLGGVAYALIPDPDHGPRKPVTVTGLIGSEKRAFFEDQQVKDELAKQGLEVRADSTGSWTMVDQAKQPDLDFAFPASASPVNEIKHIWGLQDSPLVPFYSPLVVVAHQPVADVLEQNGLAARAPGSGLWTLKMDDYLAAVRNGKTWQSLTGTAGHSDMSGKIFVTTTDPQSSNSGAMYIALLSFILNNHQAVSDQAGIDTTKEVLRTATAVQGSQKSSSDEPFKDFLAGVGNPLVFAYESQVAQLSLNNAPTSDTVVLYPDTTVYSDHTLVARTANGRKLADLLHDDPELRRLEVKFGFRPQSDPDAFAKAVQGKVQPVFAPDLSTAHVQQPSVPTQDVLLKLVNAAKGNG